MSEHKHYPKYLYHAAETPRLVHSEDEHDRVGEGWHESPADLTKPESVPEKQPVVSGNTAIVPPDAPKQTTAKKGKK